MHVFKALSYSYLCDVHQAQHVPFCGTRRNECDTRDPTIARNLNDSIEGDLHAYYDLPLKGWKDKVSYHKSPHDCLIVLDNSHKLYVCMACLYNVN